MDKDLILNEIKKHYKFNSDVDFANFLGIKTTRLSNWRKRNTLDYKLVSTICEDINANWLLTGNGPMLKSELVGSSDHLSQSHIQEPLSYSNVDYKVKYYELLEENRELRIKTERIEYKHNKELEKLKQTLQTKVQELEDYKKELEKFRKSKITPLCCQCNCKLIQQLFNIIIKK